MKQQASLFSMNCCSFSIITSLSVPDHRKKIAVRNCVTFSQYIPYRSPSGQWHIVKRSYSLYIDAVSVVLTSAINGCNQDGLFNPTTTIKWTRLRLDKRNLRWPPRLQYKSQQRTGSSPRDSDEAAVWSRLEPLSI